MGLFLLGAAYGSVGQDIDELVGDNPQLSEVFARAGASLTGSYLATTLLISALIGAGYAVSAALRLRSEETAGRAEPLLAAPVARWRWAGSHLAVTIAGTVTVVAAGGLGTGVAYGAVTGDPGQVPRLLGAALVYVPAVWVLVGFSAALFGLVPRAAALAWAGLAGCILVALLGPLLKIPEWLASVSPFDHLPQVPAAEFAAAPLAVLTAVAAAVVAVGVAAFRKRDVG